MVGPPDLWRMKRDFQFDFLVAQGLGPHHFLIDIGCGTLRGGIPLIRYLETGNYFGFDVQAAVIDEGRKELAEAGLEGQQPTLIRADGISELDIASRFDFAWAFSVLIHLDDRRLAETLSFVASHLADDGVFLANVKMGEPQDGTWRGFSLVRRRFEFYRDEAEKAGLAMHDLGTLPEVGHYTRKPAHDDQHMLRFTLADRP